MKRIVCILTFVVAVCTAHAQLLSGLLFAAASGVLNHQLAKGDQRTISAVKVMCDIMVPDATYKSGYRFANTVWDPTTQTSVFMVDGLAFRVKSFTNGLPSRELKYYLNDRLVAIRHVEADKGKGVIGDYPIIDSKDITVGANQIKIVHNRQEIGSCTFVRIPSVNDVLDLAADPEMREKLYGFGGASFPSVPTFLARLPDGSTRTFLSLDEMKAALQNPSGQGAPAVQPDPATRSTEPPASQPAPICWSGQFQFGFHPSQLSDVLYGHIQGEAPWHGGETDITIPQGRRLAVLLTSDQPFGVALCDKDGNVVPNGVRRAASKSGHYEYFGDIVLDNDHPLATLVVSDAQNHVSTLHCKLGGGE